MTGKLLQISEGTVILKVILGLRFLTANFVLTYTQNVIAECPSLRAPMLSQGRLAQLVRAPRLHRGGRRFESCTAHHLPSYSLHEILMSRGSLYEQPL